MVGGGEHRHVGAGPGEDDLRGGDPGAGDLVQALDVGQRHQQALPRLVVVGVVRAGGGGQVGEAGGDAGGEPVGLHRQVIDGVRQHPQHERVVFPEPAGQCLLERGGTGLDTPVGQAREGLGAAFAGDQCLEHRAARDPEDVGDHRRELDLRVFQELLRALSVPGALVGEDRAGTGQVPQLTDRFRGHERGPEHAVSGELGRPHRVQLDAPMDVN
ncbi:hypothetical protein [Streptomyces sp. NPDC057910]|uniref:hypothetical protein n=1 Tax=Streptomyces sp. NPDC057910 TaxID=3346278 RepID=UPI0036E41C99